MRRGKLLHDVRREAEATPDKQTLFNQPRRRSGRRDEGVGTSLAHYVCAVCRDGESRPCDPSVPGTENPIMFKRMLVVSALALAPLGASAYEIGNLTCENIGQLAGQTLLAKQSGVP